MANFGAAVIVFLYVCTMVFVGFFILLRQIGWGDSPPHLLEITLWVYLPMILSIIGVYGLATMSETTSSHRKILWRILFYGPYLYFAVFLIRNFYA